MSSPAKHIVIDARIRRSSTGRYADRLLEHLQNIDHVHRYTVLLQPDDPWQPRAQNFAAAPCSYPQFSFNPLHQFGFARQLRRLRPNLVHFTMTQQPIPYFGTVVTTTHDLTMFNFVRRGAVALPVHWLKMAGYRFLFWWAHKKSRHIIVPTRTVAKELIKYEPFTKEKVVVTYEASEPPLKDKAVQPQKVSGEFLLYVGTAFPHKNLPKLIEAFDILHAERPHLKLVLAGKRDIHSRELEALARRHPSYKNIIFTGYVSDAELKWLYEHCAAYVFASLSEGFGLPPLEAMAHGAPVVSSNASCMPEVYEAAAHYFNPHRPADMAKHIAEVLDDKKLRRQLIIAGHEQIKKFSWRTTAEETLTVYKATLGETAHL